MDINKLNPVVKELEAERDRINSTLQSLYQLGGHRGTSRPASTPAKPSSGTANKQNQGAKPGTPTGRKFTMSPAARQKIAQAQKARWAKLRSTNPQKRAA